MVLVLAAGALPSVLVGDAFAAGGPCGTNGVFNAPTMCTYGATGAEDTFSVPSGVSSVHIVAVGARGGASGPCYPPGPSSGGFGAAVSADIPVGSLSLTTLFVEVGGPGATNSTCSSLGSTAGGFNGGGTGGAFGCCATIPAGGGGGASDVRSVSRANPGSLASRLVVAGGGGGGGAQLYSPGGAGGVAGMPGSDGGPTISCCGPGLAGGAGTSSAGGAGGGGCDGGQSGAEGVGGAGGVGCSPYGPGGGGGGGGGYFGGGGGGAGVAFSSGGGGGGGSSAVVSPATASSPPVTDSTGTPSVTITWSLDGTPPTTTIGLGPSEPDGANDWYISDVAVAVSASDGQGGSGVAETRCVLDPAPAPASFDDLPAGCPYTGAGANVTADGEHTLFAASRDDAGNEETPVSQSFKIDQTTAALTFSGGAAPADGYLAIQIVTSFPATVGAQPIDVDGDVSDATSGVASLELNGVPATLGWWSASGVALNPGANTLTATATDAAGNSAQVSVSVTLDRDLDDDGIANNVDQIPGTASSGFSDSALSGTGSWPTTGTVLSIPAGATIAIVDASSPGAGVRTTVTTASPSDRVRIQLADKASTIKLAQGTYTLTDPVLDTTVEVTSGPGPAEIELTLNGSPIVITIPDGAAATITETISGGALTALVVAPLTGTVTLNGEALTTGEAVALGALGAKLSVSGTSFNLSGTFTPGPASDGLHALTEEVSLRIGPYSFPIPGESFTVASDGAYSFTGTVAGARLSVQLKPARGGGWTLKANGKPVAGLTNPVSVSLRVGDDMGVKKLTASLRS